MTAEETRDAIAEHVAERGEWVPIGELAEWMRTTLGLSQGQGTIDLRVLVREGRLERRPTGDITRPRYEYRARRPAAHTGATRVARRIECRPVSSAAARGRERILELLADGPRVLPELQRLVPCSRLTLWSRLRELEGQVKVRRLEDRTLGAIVQRADPG